MKLKHVLAGAACAAGLVVAGLTIATPAVQAADNTVTWEAEGGKVAAPFVIKSGARNDKRPKPQKNSGAGYVEIADKANGEKKEGDGSSLPGHATYKVKVPAAGQYILWARVLWPNGCGNSFYVRKEGRPKQVLGEDGTYDAWHWIKLQGPKLTLSAGVNTIEVLNREDGVILDQLQLTTSGRIPTAAVKATPGALQ